MMHKLLALVCSFSLLLSNMNFHQDNVPQITQDAAVEIAIQECMAITSYDRDFMDENFEASARQHSFENGTQVWFVRLLYLPVNDSSCFMNVEIDAASGHVYDVGPARFTEMLKVYDEFEFFFDYSRHYTAMYAERYGLPTMLWNYEQYAEYTAEHFSIASFAAYLDATLPTEEDISYEEAVAIARSKCASLLAGTDKEGKVAAESSIFHASCSYAFGGLQGDRECKRVWEFQFHDANILPICTVYILSPTGEVDYRLFNRYHIDNPS